MTLLLAIDPGKVSGVVLYDTTGELRPLGLEFDANSPPDTLNQFNFMRRQADHMCIEMPTSHGNGQRVKMQHVIDCGVTAGRFIGQWEALFPERSAVMGMTRQQVLQGIGIPPFAKGNRDSLVRAQLLKIYGGKEKALGTKKEPGPLFHIPSSGGHLWAALAVAVACEMPLKRNERIARSHEGPNEDDWRRLGL